jgi:hypothetical protein
MKLQEAVKYIFDLIMYTNYDYTRIGYSGKIDFKEIMKTDNAFRYAYLNLPANERQGFITEIIHLYANQYFCSYIEYFTKNNSEIYNPRSIRRPAELLPIKSLREIPLLTVSGCNDTVACNNFLSESITKYSPTSFDEMANLNMYYWSITIKDNNYAPFVIFIFDKLSTNEILANVLTNYSKDGLDPENSYDNIRYNRGDKIYIKIKDANEVLSDEWADFVITNNNKDKNVVVIKQIIEYNQNKNQKGYNVILSDNYTINPTLKLDIKVNKLKAVFYMNVILRELIKFIKSSGNINNLYNILSDDNVMFKFSPKDEQFLTEIRFINWYATKNLKSFGAYIKDIIVKRNVIRINDISKDYEKILKDNDFYFWLQIFFGESNHYLMPAQAYDKNYERILLRDANKMFEKTPELNYTDYMNYCNKHLPKVLPEGYLDPRAILRKNSDGNNIMTVEDYNKFKSKIKITLKELLSMQIITSSTHPSPTIFGYTYKTIAEANSLSRNNIAIFGNNANIAWILCIMRLAHIEKINKTANSFALGFFLLKVCIYCKYDDDWKKYSETFMLVIKKLIHPDYTKQITVDECFHILSNMRS